MRAGAVAAVMLAVVLVVVALLVPSCASHSGAVKLGDWCEVSWDEQLLEAKVHGSGTCRLPPDIAPLVPFGSKALLQIGCTGESPYAAAWIQALGLAPAESPPDGVGGE